MRRHVVVVAHGSREPAAIDACRAFVEAWGRGRAVSIGYVELERPSVEEALAAAARQADEVVALPLFFFAAGHVKNDLPLALDGARRAFSHVRFLAARPLGVDPRLAEALADRAVGDLDAEARARTVVVAVGRGASDPDANGDFCKLVRLLAEGRGLREVHAAFCGITRPLVAETLEAVARARPERVRVAPCLLFGGRLVEKLKAEVAAFQSRYPWIRAEVAPPLGDHPALLALLDARVAEAGAGASPLACDGCQYRLPLPGRAREVGGLRALLWSLRHVETHGQAAPHTHAHRPLARHVLVCGNADCAERGSVALLSSLRRLLKDAGRRDIQVTRTSCMGRCGEGPTVVVYPDGIWYRGVREDDARELVDGHLVGDRLVARLVDNIMQ